MTERRFPLPPPNSLPRRTDGVPVEPFDHGDAFLAGARAAMTALAGVAPALAADPEITDIWRGTRARVVLEHTAQYSHVARILRHPAIMHNPFLAEGAFHGLVDSHTPEAIRAAERAAALRGDVPYFEADADSRDLVTCDGDVVPGYFAGSALDRLRDRIDRLVPERSALLWTTEAALCGAGINKTRSYGRRNCCATPPAALPAPASERALLLDAATAIAHRLTDLAHDSGTELSWLMLTTGGKERWRVAVADDSLFLGTLGLLLFFDTLCDLTAADDRVRTVRDRLRAQWEDTDPGLSEHGLSAFHGTAGDLYVTGLIAARNGDDDGSLRSRTGHLIDLLDQDTDLLDVTSGAAGIVLALCAAARAADDGDPLRERALDCAARHVRVILGALRTRERGKSWDTVDGAPVIGFAHGSAGISHALTEYAALTGWNDLARRCRDAARTVFEWECSQFDAATRNWPDLRASTQASLPDGERAFSFSWCNGAAGIGLARAAVVTAGSPFGHSDRIADDLESAITTAMRTGLGFSQGLCHGDLGVVETLLSGAVALDRPDWSSTARRIGVMVATQVLADDGRVTQELGSGVDLPGLVNGASGVGYELLRIARPDKVPSVLRLQAPLVIAEPPVGPVSVTAGGLR